YSKASVSPDADIENNPPCDDPEMPDEALEAVSVINPVPKMKFSKEQRLAVFDKVIHSVRQIILNESVACSSLTLDDYFSLLGEVCNKITTSNDRKERYSLLTLAPQSWSNNQVANYFGVSIHATKKILSTQALERNITEIQRIKRVRKNMTEEDNRRIVDFYNKVDNFPELKT
ncbi:hypothetical protein OUZ56_005977, partial [Daphnia magna]